MLIPILILAIVLVVLLSSARNCEMIGSHPYNNRADSATGSRSDRY